MPHFIVTFRIKDDKDYQARYDSFMETAKSLAKYSPWDQTTSFLALQSTDANATSSSLCSSLYVDSKFDSTKDVMVVVDLDKRTKSTKGKIEYEGLLDAGLGF
ncbi:hypothetical protein H0A70_08095 [Alcaligenaceae bacterium]|nr:hypothetical protein [Alcaligenaceae bacterium]